MARDTNLIANDSIEAILLDDCKVVIDKESTVIGGAWQGKTAAGVPRPWDPESIQFFYDRTRELRNPFILDVGANTGIYCLLPVANPQITGMAFEPNPRAYRLLQRNLCLNGLERCVQTMPLALSDGAGSVVLKIPASGVASGLANIGTPRRFDRWKEVCVPTDTLDNVATRRAIPRVDLIKVDTEGCELFVLRGGEQLIRQHHPGILTEFEERNTAQFGYHPDEIMRLLCSWGYSFVRISKCDAYFYPKATTASLLSHQSGLAPAHPATVPAFDKPAANGPCAGYNVCAGRAETPTDRPLVLISSCRNAQKTGDARYNGGLKLYNLWVKLLRQHGFQAYVVTHDGRYTKWMLEHQPHVSVSQVLRWKQADLPLRFVTGWAHATEFIELAEAVYFYDCELRYTSGPHFDVFKEMIEKGKIVRLATNSRTQQAWHMSQWKRPVHLINEWCDPDHWYSSPEQRIPLRIGFMNEGSHSPEHIAVIEKACDKAGIRASFVLIQGDEDRVAQAMRTCDLFLGLNLGKHTLWGEGCPRSPQEALHSGCVLLAYDVLGNREYLLPNFSGLVIPRGDVDEMARQVVRVLQDPDLKERVRRQGMALVKATFSPETCWPLVRDFLELREPTHAAPRDVTEMPSLSVLRKC